MIGFPKTSVEVHGFCADFNRCHYGLCLIIETLGLLEWGDLGTLFHNERVKTKGPSVPLFICALYGGS